MRLTQLPGALASLALLTLRLRSADAAPAFATNRTILIGGLIAISLLLGCANSGPLVHADYDKQVAFSNYHTFGFPANLSTDRGGYTTLVTSHFKDAVQREMTARGYTFSTTDPDLLVNFYSESRRKLSAYSQPMSSFYMTAGYAPLYRPYGARYMYPTYGYGWYAPWPLFEPDIHVYETETGSIKLDVVDTQRKQSIWEARAEQALSEKTKSNPQPFIDNIITAMFRKFPASASSSR
jgi:hypothetical protein